MDLDWLATFPSGADDMVGQSETRHVGDRDIFADIQDFDDKLKAMLRFLNPSSPSTLPSTATTGSLDDILMASNQSTAEQLKECLQRGRNLVTRLNVEELDVYRKCKFHQNTSSVTGDGEKPLRYVQFLCEQLAKQLYQLQAILEYCIQHQGLIDPISSERFQVEFHSIFETFLSNCLIIEEQPPQIMKIRTRFTVQLRWLLGNIMINEWKGHLLSGIKAEIFGTNLVRRYISGESSSSLQPSGMLSSDRVKPEWSESDEGTKQCDFKYRNLQLNQIDRESKKSRNMPGKSTTFSPDTFSSSSSQSVAVTDEKFAIIFSAKVAIGVKTWHIFTTSLPIVVITHGIQDTDASATIIWDNCFSLPNRLPFEVPESVPWNKIALVLSSKFEHSLGVGLNDGQLSMLREKVIPGSCRQSEDEANAAMVSFSRFAKEPIHGTPFSFWEWFYQCLKVTQRHAASEWKNHHLFGFIMRGDAEIMLHGSPPGTFLLRFSESVLGGISICYTASNGNSHSLYPFTTKQLSFRCLGDSLWDLTNLHCLYHGVRKETAFPVSHHFASLSPNYSFIRPDEGPSDSRSQDQRLGLGRGIHTVSDYVESYPRISIPPQYR